MVIVSQLNFEAFLFADAKGLAVMNLTRFAVLSIRFPSLTRSVDAQSFRACASQQKIPHPETGPLLSSLPQCFP